MRDEREAVNGERMSGERGAGNYFLDHELRESDRVSDCDEFHMGG